ncbi:MAG: hypothetical protein OR994_07980, partial [Candidatus Poseidoniales archaeon]|nr:hypothetical protein [Candidatus Poseidoniales archaeon]
MGRLTAVVFSLLMLAMSISVAVNSLNENVEISTLEDFEEPQNVILPLAQLNKPGFQEGSIYTNTTFSSGGMHNCA